MQFLTTLICIFDYQFIQSIVSILKKHIKIYLNLKYILEIKN